MIEGSAFSRIVDEIYRIEYPDQEDESMTLCWEIQCGNCNGQAVTWIDPGYWGNEIIRDIVDTISGILDDEDSVSSLKEIIEQ